MVGGKGNDTYHVDDNLDHVVEAAGQGYDTVISIAALTVLGDNVEKLVLAPSSSGAPA